MIDAPPNAPQDLIMAAELYAATFSGRTDAYSYWAPDSNGPEGVIPAHWKAVRQPLTGKRVLAAFETNVPLSSYLLTPDSLTHVAALDIDRDTGLDMGKRVAKVVAKAGGVCYIEASSRGCHLWIVMSERRPAVLVRRALRGLIAEADLPKCPGSGQPRVPNKQGKPVCAGCGTGGQERIAPVHDDPKIELRPGSDRLNGPDSLGHCIRMPTMPHHRTGKRKRLFSSEGAYLSGRLTEMMLEIEECPVSIIEDAAEKAPLPPISPPRDLAYPLGLPNGGSVVDILMNLYGVIEAKPGTAIICPAHDDTRPSLSIARDDQRVFCKSPRCELYNNGRGRGINELVRMAPRRGGQ